MFWLYCREAPRGQAQTPTTDRWNNKVYIKLSTKMIHNGRMARNDGWKYYN